MTTKEWPEGLVPTGAVTDPEQVVGRFAIMSMVENEPVLEAKTADSESDAGAAADVKPGGPFFQFGARKAEIERGFTPIEPLNWDRYP